MPEYNFLEYSQKTKYHFGKKRLSVSIISEARLVSHIAIWAMELARSREKHMAAWTVFVNTCIYNTNNCLQGTMCV